MVNYEIYTDKIYNVNIREDGTFFILTADKETIRDEMFIQIVKREIDTWKMADTPGTFTLQYVIRKKNHSGNQPVPHDHYFIQVDYKMETKRKNRHKILPGTKLYRKITSVYRCTICNFLYKTEINQLL